MLRQSTMVLVMTVCVLLCWAMPAGAQVTIPWSTIDSGGGTSSGGSFVLSGTIGQPDAGLPMTGGGFTLTGGFWSASAVGGSDCDNTDFNQDGDFPTPLDLEDFINAVAGNICSTCSTDLDFNNDGDFPTPLDIEAFISVLSGGPCVR